MDYCNLLKNNNLKVTKGRIEILKILFQYKKDLTADFIYLETKKHGVEVNQSTVYRALEVFEEKNIVEKYPLQDGVFAYDVVEDAHKHLLKCSICHKEIEIPCPMRQLSALVKSETGFTLNEHDLVLEGVCEECSHKKKK